MNTVILAQGFDLLIFGMGTVFLFLSILVLGTMSMSTVLRKYMPEAEPVVLVKSNPSPRTDAVNPKVLAAIKDAIQQHRAQS